jgi:hypothetical protein
VLPNNASANAPCFMVIFIVVSLLFVGLFPQGQRLGVPQKKLHARMTRCAMTAKNSGVEGEHEKRDDEAHTGQCNYKLNHAGSIDRNFLMPGESV